MTAMEDEFVIPVYNYLDRQIEQLFENINSSHQPLFTCKKRHKQKNHQKENKLQSLSNTSTPNSTWDFQRNENCSRPLFSNLTSRSSQPTNSCTRLTRKLLPDSSLSTANIFVKKYLTDSDITDKNAKENLVSNTKSLVNTSSDIRRHLLDLHTNIDCPDLYNDDKIQLGDVNTRNVGESHVCQEQFGKEKMCDNISNNCLDGTCILRSNTNGPVYGCLTMSHKDIQIRAKSQRSSEVFADNLQNLSTDKNEELQAVNERTLINQTFDKLFEGIKDLPELTFKRKKKSRSLPSSAPDTADVYNGLCPTDQDNNKDVLDLPLVNYEIDLDSDSDRSGIIPVFRRANNDDLTLDRSMKVEKTSKHRNHFDRNCSHREKKDNLHKNRNSSSSQTSLYKRSKDRNRKQNTHHDKKHRENSDMYGKKYRNKKHRGRSGTCVQKYNKKHRERSGTCVQKYNKKHRERSGTCVQKYNKKHRERNIQKQREGSDTKCVKKSSVAVNVDTASHLTINTENVKSRHKKHNEGVRKSRHKEHNEGVRRKESLCRDNLHHKKSKHKTALNKPEPDKYRRLDRYVAETKNVGYSESAEYTEYRDTYFRRYRSDKHMKTRGAVKSITEDQKRAKELVVIDQKIQEEILQSHETHASTSNNPYDCLDDFSERVSLICDIDTALPKSHDTKWSNGERQYNLTRTDQSEHVLHNGGIWKSITREKV